MIRSEILGGNVAVITWDLPDRPVNVMNKASSTAFREAVDAAIADPAIKGVVIASAKRDFIVGADLAEVMADPTPAAIHAFCRRDQMTLRTMETSGKPFVAALNGTALGGGLEMALACHRRIAANRSGMLIGLPEVTLGLLPGAGGTQRLPRMIGIRKALPFLMEGLRVAPAEALAAGLIDEIVEPSELLDRAVAWIRASQPEDGQRPWDRKAFHLPGGDITTVTAYSTFAIETARLNAKTSGNYPAPLHILSSVYEGCQTDFDSGLKAEASHFAACASSTAARNMTRTSFFAVSETAKLKHRPQGHPPAKFMKIGVLGAGMMGRGIARVCAAAGMETVLLDVSEQIAIASKDTLADAVEQDVNKNRLGAAQAAELLKRIRPTASYDDLIGCDLVVEAVVEDSAAKAEVIARAEKMLAQDSIFGSNTSTLPISGLAPASRHPENFIGIHFFSTVERMRLVEIIRGHQTSDACLAKAMDFVKAIGKVPVVVNDSRGFFTSRVFNTYLSEGLAMLAEGIRPAMIENCARQAGMAVGPLALADEVSIDLIYRLMRQTQSDLGDKYIAGPGDGVVEFFHDKLGRSGRKSGKGFYDYGSEGKCLWPSLSQYFPLALTQPSPEEVKQRLLTVQAVEAVRCLEEKVIATPQDADVAAVLGWSFPSFWGGPFSMIHSIGVEKFIRRCEVLAAAHGPRFSPPALLQRMSDQQQAFYVA